jgi:hypothetical protein
VAQKRRNEPVYPSKQLRELISVDPELPEADRDALYKVLERNQRAFGFDGRLGHLASRVHIDLKPGTKPISMPPYAASPAKREIIDKQIDLWLSQEVIEESKSPWGAPVIIVLRNRKPRLCIDWRRLNTATVADQHPIPSSGPASYPQTDGYSPGAYRGPVPLSFRRAIWIHADGVRRRKPAYHGHPHTSRSAPI